MSALEAVEDFALAELRAVLQSKTFKAICALEGLACTAFVDGVLDGTIPLSRHSVELFLMGQLAAVLVLCWRHTQAGIEAKLDGKVDPQTVRAIEERAQARFLKLLEARGLPLVADAIKTDLAAPASPGSAAPVLTRVG